MFDVSFVLENVPFRGLVMVANEVLIPLATSVTLLAFMGHMVLLRHYALVLA